MCQELEDIVSTGLSEQLNKAGSQDSNDRYRRIRNIDRYIYKTLHNANQPSRCRLSTANYNTNIMWKTNVPVRLLTPDKVIMLIY